MSGQLVFGKNFEKLKKKKILVVGVGGVGNYVALHLARMGIPLTIVDPDIVDETNLERQILFDKKDNNQLKVEVIKKKLNDYSNIKDIYGLFKPEMVEGMDLVIDCTDNMEARMMINESCINNNVPWIYTAAVQDKGSLMFLVDDSFRLLFKNKDGEVSCDVGIMNYTVAIVGSLAVSLAVKFLAENIVEERLIRIRGSEISYYKIKDV